MLASMDAERLRQQLGEAEEHVAQAVRHVAEQWNLIMRLEREGRDTAGARPLLALVEESRHLHIAEKDHLSGRLKTTREAQVAKGHAHAT
jgi:hypothetical protein